MSTARHPATTRILVLRHEPCTSLGLLHPIAQQTQSQIHYLEISQGERLTVPLDHYSHIVILGGTASAYEEHQHEFLRDEFKLVEAAIDLALPIVGICLGSQILAKVLGARVYRGEAGREAGWCEVALTKAAATDPLLQGFPPQFRVFQSHQDTFDLPASTVHLAQSATYPHQGFRYRDHVWALQFHLEVDEKVLNSCSALLKEELRSSNVQDKTIEQFLAEAQQQALAVAPIADRFMQQFLQRSPVPLPL